MSSSPDEPLPRCHACGKPIGSRGDAHAECNESKDEKQRAKAPQKVCSKCGAKAHVRTLVCKTCGAMF